MSYEIFKSVKQLPDGTFYCESASSNCTNQFGNRDFSKWTMDYYSKEYPYASNEELKALFVLSSVYNGSVFYQSNWKQLQKEANKFMRDRGYDWKVSYENKSLWYSYVREFIQMRQMNRFIKKKSFIVQIGMVYVSRKGKKSCRTVYEKENAKVFKAKDKSEIEDMFRGYTSYGVSVIEINGGTNE